MTLKAMPLSSVQAPGPEAEALCRDVALLSGGRASTASQDRIAYARDCWPKTVIWTRAGLTPRPPDVVAWPSTTEEVAAIVRFAASRGIPIVPFGAGSGVCGGTLALNGGICLDLKRLSDVGTVDSRSLQVSVGAGAVGENFERQLARQGFTLGHFPSSIYCSTVGGWLAARSAGQCSNKYGKIEDMVASVTAVLGTGDVVTTPAHPEPGFAATQILVGSEGTLGVITNARLFVHPAPRHRAFRAYRFESLAAGAEAIRKIFWSGARPAVVRLYDPFDTLIAGTGRHKTKQAHPHPAEGAPSRLKLRLERLASQVFLGRPAGMNRLARALNSALLVLVFEGEPELVEAEEATAAEVCRKAKDLGPGPARAWMERRYAVSYGQSKIFDAGAFADTMEVAATWDRVMDVYHQVRSALAPFAFVMAHFSHAYVEGCSLYFTFASAARDVDASVERYDEIWRAGLKAALEAGASVSHHHGVGLSKGAALRSELGDGFALLEALKRSADPTGILNPGKLGLGMEAPATSLAPTRRPTDPMSGTLRVAATERLGRVEQQLASAGLTLGPQPAHVLDLTVSEWLEGPWEGLRAIPGGRLEPAALAVDAAIPKGRYISRESPRSATGPDLDALVLGRRKKNVRLEWAVLRGLPLQEDRRHLLSELASARDAVAVLRALIRRDVAMVSARARRAGPGMTVEIQIAGSRRRVERDSAVFLEEARNLGATCSESTPSPPVEAAADSEVAWDDLELALQNGGDLYRLARESVEVVTSSDLGVGTRLWPTPSPAPLAGPLRRLLEPFAEQAG